MLLTKGEQEQCESMVWFSKSTVFLKSSNRKLRFKVKMSDMEREIENMRLNEMIFKNKMLRMHLENARLTIDNRELHRQYNIDRRKITKLEKSCGLLQEENRKFKSIIKEKNGEIAACKYQIREYVVRDETAELKRQIADGK